MPVATFHCCTCLQEFPLFFTAGVHPHNAKDCDDTTLDELRQLAAHERCVAIGAMCSPLPESPACAATGRSNWSNSDCQAATLPTLP